MSMTSNPFAILGLPERPDLDDETVRAAWRQIAAATHPDRADGGDLARYTQATAAFHELQTPWGRSEAYADLADQARADGHWDAYPGSGLEDGTEPLPAIPGGFDVVIIPPPPFWFAHPLTALAQIPGRILHGRPGRMLIRAAIAALLCLGVLALIPGTPSAPADVTILITAFVVTARSDLAPPPRR
jgi:curved DNA-binding protein CbpA